MRAIDDSDKSLQATRVRQRRAHDILCVVCQIWFWERRNKRLVVAEWCRG